MKQLTIAGKIHRDKAARSLRRLLPDDRQDAIDALLSDPLADIIRAADAEGFTREEIRRAIFTGAFNGWAEVRGEKVGDVEGEAEGYRFARRLAPECDGCGTREHFISSVKVDGEDAALCTLCCDAAKIEGKEVTCI